MKIIISNKVFVKENIIVIFYMKNSHYVKHLFVFVQTHVFQENGTRWTDNGNVVVGESVGWPGPDLFCKLTHLLLKIPF